MFLINVEDRGEATILCCRGSLVAREAVERFRDIALRYCDGLLLIEASELDRIDAAGVGVWLELHQNAERSGGTVIIADPALWVRECLRLTRVDTVLLVVSRAESEGAA
ncbi:MAG TPA: STAS domain-containing protein, partial [Terriglobales bacterium]|nr:STAS domain-containing protein [Terriglobales bacterium]